jgi:hypothetical protein
VRERLGALVDLDPRDHALRGEQLGERRAVVCLLADRLVEEDDAADELLDPRRREQQVAVGAPVLLGRLDADRVEALLDGAGALVRGEDPFPLGDERGCGLMELGVRHGNLPVSLSPGFHYGRATIAAAGGSSSVGRALASQAKGRGFEPRLPLRLG